MPYIRCMGRRRELEQRIQGLEWQEFERLVYDLIHAERPDAMRLKPPDSGVDVLVPAAGGIAPAAFQIKHYTGRMNWKKCEQSLTAALALRPSSVTFVFPQDLSASQLATFDRRLAAAHHGVAVRCWTLSKLCALLDKYPGVRDSHFGLDVRSRSSLEWLTRALTDQTRIERLLNVAATIGEDDPNFRYEVQVSEMRLPAQLDDESHLTIDLQRDEQHLRLTAKPRHELDGPIAEWAFADDESGAAARHQALREVARGQAEVVVESGVTYRFRHPPKRLEEVLGPTEQVLPQGRVCFTPGPGIPVRLTVHGEARVERTFSVYPFPHIDGFDRAFVGFDRCVMPLFCFRFPEGPRVEFAFKPLLDLGSDATVNAEATAFSLAVFRAERIEFFGQFFPDGQVTVPAGTFNYGAEVVEVTEFWNQLYTGAAYVEQQLGAKLLAHEPPFTHDEIGELGNCVEALLSGQRGRAARGTKTS